MRKLLSTIALAALAATALQADPGGGKGNGGGNGRGNGGGQEAPGERGGNGGGNGGGNHDGGGKHDGAGQRETDRGAGQSVGQAMREQRGNGGDAGQRGQIQRDRMQDDRGKANKNEREQGHRAGAAQGRDGGRAEWRDGTDQYRRSGDDRGNAPRSLWSGYDARGLISGCPPGLAKKNNGCLPPGQARQRGYGNYDRYDANWWGLRGLNNLSGYRYYDGNLVRLSSGGAISDYYPLLGGALAPGNPWPTGWQPTPLSPYYSDYYGLGDDYRYFDGAIYRVDPATSAIQTVAALLTGDTFAVGQRIPAGYDAYNVPYQYRDQYADGPDAAYRYNDGYVYKTDPKTQLILAAIQLLS